MQLIRRFSICCAVCLCLNPLACQLQERKAIGLSGLKKKLEIQGSRSAYDALHLLLSTHYTDLSAEERKTLRETLKKYASWPFETICPDTEPGTKITIQGQVIDEKGRPLQGIKLHIFHTDHRGYYSPLDSIKGQMLEQDPRLEGFLTTDSDGKYSIKTIRPGNYPKKYEGRLLPQHIHIMINTEGYQERAIQMVFKDDPAMSPHWIDWAKKRKHPIIQLLPSASGLCGEADLILVKN